MGEAKRRSNVAVRDAIEALAVDTVGGRVQVRWNTHRAATPFGQLAFFVEFLNLTGLYRRYAHIAALRADAISPQLLGLSTVVSEDTVRRALSAIDEAAGRTWMQTHLDASVWPLLSAPWILDIDVTVKPLYGKQEGAVLG